MTDVTFSTGPAAGWSFSLARSINLSPAAVRRFWTIELGTGPDGWDAWWLWRAEGRTVPPFPVWRVPTTLEQIVYRSGGEVAGYAYRIALSNRPDAASEVVPITALRRGRYGAEIGYAVLPGARLRELIGLGVESQECPRVDVDANGSAR